MKPEQLTRVAGAVLAVALIGALVAPAFAADYRLGALRIKDPWARARHAALASRRCLHGHREHWRYRRTAWSPVPAPTPGRRILLTFVARRAQRQHHEEELLKRQARHIVTWAFAPKRLFSYCKSSNFGSHITRIRNCVDSQPTSRLYRSSEAAEKRMLNCSHHMTTAPNRDTSTSAGMS